MKNFFCDSVCAMSTYRSVCEEVGRMHVEYPSLVAALIQGG